MYVPIQNTEVDMDSVVPYIPYQLQSSCILKIQVRGGLYNKNCKMQNLPF